MINKLKSDNVETNIEEATWKNSLEAERDTISFIPTADSFEETQKIYMKNQTCFS